MSTNNAKKGDQSQRLPSNDLHSGTGRHPQNTHKSNSSFPRHADNPNLTALGRDRSIGLPPRPLFPQGASPPNSIHQPKESTTSTPAPRNLPESEFQSPSYLATRATRTLQEPDSDSHSFFSAPGKYPAPSLHPLSAPPISRYSRFAPGQSSSSTAPTYPRPLPQPTTYPLPEASHRIDTRTVKSPKPDHSQHVSSSSEADYRASREQVNTDKMWLEKEHEQFREVMMSYLVLAYRVKEKAEDVFPKVSETMAQKGYQRDSEECYIYWHYFVRSAEPFKDSLLKFPPPPAHMKPHLQEKVKAQQMKKFKEDCAVELAVEKVETERLGKIGSYNQALVTMERARNQPRTLQATRQVASRIQFSAFEQIKGDGGSMEVKVPEELVGRIIGYRGETVKGIEDGATCYIKIEPQNTSVNGMRPVFIYGTKQAALDAQNRILELFNLPKIVAPIVAEKSLPSFPSTPVATSKSKIVAPIVPKKNLPLAASNSDSIPSPSVKPKTSRQGGEGRGSIHSPNIVAPSVTKKKSDNLPKKAPNPPPSVEPKKLRQGGGGEGRGPIHSPNIIAPSETKKRLPESSHPKAPKASDSLASAEPKRSHPVVDIDEEDSKDGILEISHRSRLVSPSVTKRSLPESSQSRAPDSLAAKRSRPSEEEGEGESSSRPKRARSDLSLPAAEQSSVESEGFRRVQYFDAEIKKFQQKIDDTKEKKKLSVKGVEDTDAKLAQIELNRQAALAQFELDRQAVLANMSKLANEVAAFDAEIEELENTAKSLKIARGVFFD